MKALIVIDMQKDYVEQYEPDLLNRVNERILQAEKNNESIVYIRNTKALRNGTFTSELAEKLQILSANVFNKEKASILKNDNLITWLKDNGITEIEMIGIDGNSCVAISAQDAHNKGYSVMLPCKYIGVKNADRFLEKKKQLKKAGITICE